MSDKVIVITLYRRPEHTEQLFKSLLQCYGIEDYHVLISCDVDIQHREACDAVIDLAGVFACRHRGQTDIFMNNPKLGIDLNKMFIIPKAYEISDYMIFLEDDTPPAKDALRFYEWLDRRFKDDPNFISGNSYNRYTEIETHEANMRDHLYSVNRGGGFSPWGWSMHKDRYQRIMGDGTAYAAKWGPEVNGRFDNWFNEMTNLHPGGFSVYPVVPRTNHVTAEAAEHTPSHEYLMEHEFAPYGAWSQDVPDPGDREWTPLW